MFVRSHAEHISALVDDVCACAVVHARQCDACCACLVKKQGVQGELSRTREEDVTAVATSHFWQTSTHPYTHTIMSEDTPPTSGKGAQWLNAWFDPVANVNTLSNCIDLADLNGDGEHKLVIADLNRKLRVFKGLFDSIVCAVQKFTSMHTGTSLISENILMEVPVALCSYYMDESHPRSPVIAVAAGPHIFIYRNLRPFNKFTLPPLQVHTTAACVVHIRTYLHTPRTHPCPTIPGPFIRLTKENLTFGKSSKKTK